MDKSSFRFPLGWFLPAFFFGALQSCSLFDGGLFFLGGTPSSGSSSSPASTKTVTFTGSVSGGGNVLVAEYESLKTVATDSEGNFSMTVTASDGLLRTFVVIANGSSFEPLDYTETSASTQAVGTIATTGQGTGYEFVFDGGDEEHAPGLVQIALAKDGSLWKRSLTNDSGYAVFSEVELNTEYSVVATHDTLPQVTGVIRVYDDGETTYEWTPTDSSATTNSNGEFYLQSSSALASGATTTRGVISGYTSGSSVGQKVTLSRSGQSDRTTTVDDNGNFVFEQVTGAWQTPLDYTLELETSQGSTFSASVNDSSYRFSQVVSRIWLGDYE